MSRVSKQTNFGQILSHCWSSVDTSQEFGSDVLRRICLYQALASPQVAGSGQSLPHYCCCGCTCLGTRWRTAGKWRQKSEIICQWFERVEWRLILFGEKCMCERVRSLAKGSRGAALQLTAAWDGRRLKPGRGAREWETGIATEVCKIRLQVRNPGRKT